MKYLKIAKEKRHFENLVLGHFCFTNIFIDWKCYQFIVLSIDSSSQLHVFVLMNYPGVILLLVFTSGLRGSDEGHLWPGAERGHQDPGRLGGRQERLRPQHRPLVWGGHQRQPAVPLLIYLAAAWGGDGGAGVNTSCGRCPHVASTHKTSFWLSWDVGPFFDPPNRWRSTGDSLRPLTDLCAYVCVCVGGGGGGWGGTLRHF